MAARRPSRVVIEPVSPVVECGRFPAKVALGMKVRLATYPLGTDSAGTEAVGFGFEPIS